MDQFFVMGKMDQFFVMGKKDTLCFCVLLFGLIGGDKGALAQKCDHKTWLQRKKTHWPVLMFWELSHGKWTCFHKPPGKGGRKKRNDRQATCVNYTLALTNEIESFEQAAGSALIAIITQSFSSTLELSKSVNRDTTERVRGIHYTNKSLLHTGGGV